MRPAFSAPTRLLSATLSLVLFLTVIAPSRFAYAEPVFEPNAAWGDAEEKRLELDYRTYFEGCNNYIDKTLETWGCGNPITRTLGTCGLKRDAGDRPTPLMMLGMATETEASGDTPFSKGQIDEVWNDVGVDQFLTGLYEGALANSVVAYIRLLVQFEFQHPNATQITEAVCAKSAKGSKCSDENRKFVQGLAEEKLPKIEAEARKQPKYTPEYIAKTMNEHIGKANYWLAQLPTFKPGQKPTEDQLMNYTRSFLKSAMTPGVMRLLSVPSLYKKVGFLNTPTDLRKDVIKEWPDPRTYPADALYIQMPVAYRVKLHGYVQAADVIQAIPEAHSLIVGLLGQLHDKVSPLLVFDHATQQQAVTDLIGTNALAAHDVLFRSPETARALAPSACRAFKDFAIERASAHKSTRYKGNLVLGIGVVLALSGAIVPFLAPAWVSVVYGVSTAIALIIAVDAWHTYFTADEKLRNNVAEVLTDNESAEVIVTRVPEEIKRKSAALQNAWINTASLAVSAFFTVKQIWFTTPAPPEAGVALEKTEAIVGAKTLFAASKMAPIAIDAWSYADFKEFMGQPVDLESPPGSKIKIHAKVVAFDKPRDRVVLEIQSKTGPGGPIEFDRKNPEIRVPIEDYREAIRGFKAKN